MTPPLRERLAEVVATATAARTTAPPDDDARLSLDSLAYFDLALLLEERLGVRVPPDDMTPAHFGTFGGLLAYVERRRGAREGESAAARP